jgi:threonine aldolase
VSKHRFLVAPFVRTLEDDTWLRHARHANAMAKRLGEGLRAASIEPLFPIESNGVFVVLPDAVHDAWQRAGQAYYSFGEPDLACYRLMCSFDTEPADVDTMLDLARAVIR